LTEEVAISSASGARHVVRARHPGSFGLRHALASRLLLALSGVLLLLVAGHQPGFAQGVDPKVLEMIQGQIGAARAARDAVEAAQTQQQPQQPGMQQQVPGGTVGGPLDTTEEQLLRREQARRELDALYRPSVVEEDYRLRTGDRTLRQFGYEFFQAGPPPTGIATGAIGDDYILGIGDEVTVVFRGATNESRTSRVDRDGRLLLGSMRPIQAAGRSLGSVRSEIAAETRSTMLATDAFVSVGEVRLISVFVGGEVERPGQYSLNSLADISAAIAQAGGIRRSGSLRNVRLVRAGGGTVTVDLYGLLGIGTAPNVRLRDGDRVIVPVLGPTIAVTGAVTRPGIYELRGPASLNAVVAFAGGPVRQRGAEVTISRIAPGGQETFIRAPSTSANVSPGDVVLVLGGSPGGAVGRVFLGGNVDNPGFRPLSSAATVRDLLRSTSDLRPDTYQLAAVLIRRDPAVGALSIELVNLARELREPQSTVLRSEDRLLLLSDIDIDFINGTAVRNAILAGAGGGCPGVLRLARLVQDTGSVRFSPVTRVSRSGRDAPSCTDLFRDEPDTLAVLVENSVSVGGAVRRPGAYPVAGRVTASELALVAGGLLPNTSDLVLDLTRGLDGPAERLPVDAAGAVLQFTALAVGDDVRFNAQEPLYEARGVLIEGEVNRPGLYVIRKGETLAQLIARAGGLTPFAYPYGTVFTRETVRESIEAGFRRTARELNNGLIALAARSGDRGIEGLSNAIALIQVLATAETPGRLVIEADPRVLAIRPDLDTILEPGDEVRIPKRPNFVLALGDVQNPGALQFVEGKPANAYLRAAGGTLSTADSSRAFLVLPDGTAQPLRGGGNIAPPPGSTIIVPKDIDPLARLTFFKDVTTIVAQLATSVATIAVLATR
jgi:polysaccharide export outer membrane protein